jgi:[acyl-carrier-protein] S-malonyltransferase
MNSSFAFVFPGQGSQNIGMLADFAEKFSIVEETFNEASDTLGYDLWNITQNEETQLNQTENTQPALLAASVSLWRVWCQQNLQRPTILAGHSLGEYSALVCSDVLEFSDAVKLVHLRGKFMQQSVPAGIGAMAAVIGLDNDVISDICRQAAKNEIVSAANYNSIGQTVIAGNKAAVERATVLLKAQGARMVVPLSVSVPSHCALMQPAAESLAKQLDTMTFSKPIIPVINNAHVTMETFAERIKAALIEQLTGPVRWVETIQLMAASKITHVIECGPGKVLTGLNKRIDKQLKYSSIPTPNDLETVLSTFDG